MNAYLSALSLGYRDAKNALVAFETASQREIIGF